MALIGAIGKVVVLGGLKTAVKGAGKVAGALSSPLTKKASDAPLFQVKFQPGIRGGIAFGNPTKGTGRFLGVDHLGKVRTVGISHGTAGTVGGTVGTAAQHYSQQDDQSLGPLTTQTLVAQELGHAAAARLANRMAGQAGLKAGLATYAKSTGPLLLAEAGTYGLTAGLSNTELGQQMGIDKPMGFAEMNFTTGKNLGKALMNSGADSDGKTFGDRSREARDKAAEKDFGGAANPLNYEYGSFGEAGTSLGTWATDTVVRRPLEFFGVL